MIICPHLAVLEDSDACIRHPPIAVILILESGDMSPGANMLALHCCLNNIGGFLL